MFDLLRWLWDRASRVYEWFGTLWGKARAIVANWYVQIYYLAVSWYDKIKRYANEFYNNVKRLVDDLWIQVYLITSTWYDKIKKVVYDWWNHTIKVLEEWRSQQAKYFNDWFSQAVRDFNDWVYKKVKYFEDWYPQAKKDFVDWAYEKATVFEAWWSKLVKDYNDWWGKKVNYFQDWYPQAKKDFVDWAYEKATVFEKWWSKLVKDYNDWWAQKIKIFRDWWDGLRKTVYVWLGKEQKVFEDWWSNALKQLSTLANPIQEWADRWYPAATAFFNDPINMILGMIEGVFWAWMEWLLAVLLGGVGIEDPPRPQFGGGVSPGTPPPGPGPKATGLLFPLSSRRISGYTYNNPPGHRGVDYGLTLGQPVWSIQKGTVMSTSYGNTGYGHFVTIGHINGWWSLYGHLSKIYVAPGQAVGQGQTIGGGGSTGKSTGPHLHLEIKRNGAYVDPEQVL